MSKPIFDITQIDFSDPQDICKFISSLCCRGGELGMSLAGFKPTKETNAIRQTARQVVCKLDEIMPKMSVADAFTVVSAYDLVYRFAYLTEPDRYTLNHYVLAAFDAMLRGNKEIDQYAMYRAIAQGLSRRDEAYFDRPLTWLTTIEGQWYAESKHGFDTSTLPRHDIINRVNILLRADLRVYEGRNQAAYKNSLRTRYYQYLPA